MTELRIEHVQELLDVGDFQGEVEPVLARLCLDLDAQLQQEREGRERLDALMQQEDGRLGATVMGWADQNARLNALWLKWGSEEAEYPDTEVGRHAAALLRLCVQELRAAFQPAPQAQGDSQ